MARRRASQLDGNEILAALVARFDSSCLATVGDKLEQLVIGTKAVWGSAAGQAALQHVRNVLKVLPVETDTAGRFMLDALLIKTLSKLMGGNAVVSDVIVPSYDRNEWGFIQLPVYPGPDKWRAEAIDVVFFPGANTVADMDFCDYPWLVHELLHSVIYHNLQRVDACIAQRMDPHIRDLQVAGVADKGQVKVLHQEETNAIIRFWTPTADQKNWAHELVIDVLGVQLAGSAYIRAFVQDTADARPHDLAQSHPPLAVRNLGITLAARELGWTDEVLQLESRQREWNGSADQPINLCRAASDPMLVQACVDGAFDIARDLAFPRTRESDRQRVSALVARGETPLLGIELLLAAWHANDTLDDNAYNRWTGHVAQQLLD